MSTQLLGPEQTMPPPGYGFGGGRRSNHIAVIQTATSRWKQLPPRIHQWGPDELPDFWTRTAVQGLLTGVEETGFGNWRDKVLNIKTKTQDIHRFLVCGIADLKMQVRTE